ncbi:MAG: hypothetical protein LM559_05725 [Pyrobaculum sp.]|nr:hypothetical protein [Pyrobaculum sp.]
MSVAMKRVELASGKRAAAPLWAVVLAAHGIEAEVRRTRGGFQVIVSGDNAVKLAYTSSTGLHCLKETIGLRTTSWLKPWSWGLGESSASAGRG